MNFGIINSITKLHLVGICTESSTMHGSMNTRYICLSKAKASLRLKISMTFGSKKGTQIYYSFLSKVLANEPPPGPPKGPL